MILKIDQSVQRFSPQNSNKKVYYVFHHLLRSYSIIRSLGWCEYHEIYFWPRIFIQSPWDIIKSEGRKALKRVICSRPTVESATKAKAHNIESWIFWENTVTEIWGVQKTAATIFFYFCSVPRVERYKNCCYIVLFLAPFEQFLYHFGQI